MNFQDEEIKPNSVRSMPTLADACSGEGSGERSVDASEFLTLALSSRKFWRHDDTTNDRLGLLDPYTGERILTAGAQFDQLVSGEESKPTG
ncbi:MAG: hypothetical protein O2931_16830 [Planctomycetota bacterium]|nr:hypothetical protein [Planctomycetota bacterium]MDA1180447.1 hypothetical protein [Planctomycetota bacterium]